MYWGNTSPFIRATEQKFILIMWLNEAARRKTNQKQMLCLGCWAFLVKWSNIQAMSAAYICPQFSPGQQLKPHQSHHAQSFISPAVVCRFSSSSSSSAAVLSFCSSDCLTAENLSHISTFHFSRHSLRNKGVQTRVCTGQWRHACLHTELQELFALTK